MLLAMRHAKTEPFGGNGSDVGRELTDKGRKQAKTVAKGLAAFKMVPTRIACSSATRARQTCDPHAQGVRRRSESRLPAKPVRRRRAIRVRRARANQGKASHAARAWPRTDHSIACQWLASTESDPTLLDLLNLGMSPASIAVFGSNEPFNQWQLHSGELIALLTAKTSSRACVFRADSER